MKKILLTLFLAVMATVGLYAQQISVVSSDGSTSIYRTLKEAIEGASDGSVIYLPGGGFSIGDSVKITKKLTIIGIGPYSKSGNVDGATTISGNLFFNEGSSNSALIGCYITGIVNIGEDGATVNDVLIRCCNIYSVKVLNSTCQETVVDQNYIRSMSSFSNSKTILTNNIAQTLLYVDGGSICNNIVTTFYQTAPYTGSATTDKWYIISANNSIVNNNILFGNKTSSYGTWQRINGSNNQVNDNMSVENVGNSTIIVTNWNDVFVNYNGGAVSPTSDFHFKEDYMQYENQVGVYANGVDFDKQLAPVPYIVAKSVDTETDASGKLNIKIRVKAGE